MEVEILIFTGQKDSINVTIRDLACPTASQRPEASSGRHRTKGTIVTDGLSTVVIYKPQHATSSPQVIQVPPVDSPCSLQDLCVPTNKRQRLWTINTAGLNIESCSVVHVAVEKNKKRRVSDTPVSRQ